MAGVDRAQRVIRPVATAGSELELIDVGHVAGAPGTGIEPE